MDTLLPAETFATYSLIKHDYVRKDGTTDYKWKAQYPYKDGGGRQSEETEKGYS